MFERLRATSVGVLLGLTAYVAWLTRRFERLNDPESWQLSGPLKWFVLVGAIAGFVGGLSFVEEWLQQKRGDVFENAVFNALFALSVAAAAAIIFVSLRG